jgi:hypothetical protein
MIGKTYVTTGKSAMKGRIFVCLLNNKEVKQAGSGTGNLSKYLELHFPTEHGRYVVDSSSHTNKRRGPDGSMFQAYEFKEAAPHHVQFVFMCAQDKRPPNMAKSKGTTVFHTNSTIDL